MRFLSAFRISPHLVLKRIQIITSPPLAKILLYAPLFLTVVSLILLLALFKRLPQEVPLFYSRPWGKDQLTSPISLFIVPIGSFFWYLVTLFLIGIQTYEYRVFAQMLLLASTVVAILASTIIFNILLLIL